MLNLGKIQSVIIASFLAVGVGILVLTCYIWIQIGVQKERQNKTLLVYQSALSIKQNILDQVHNSNLLVISYEESRDINLRSAHEELWANQILPAMAELDSQSLSWDDPRKRHKVEQLSGLLENLQGTQTGILNTEQTSTSIDITSYPGYMGDTLIIDESLNSWLAQQGGAEKNNLTALRLPTENLLTNLTQLEEVLFENEAHVKGLTGRGQAVKSILIGIAALLLLGCFLIGRMLVRRVNQSISGIRSKVDVLSAGDIPEHSGNMEAEMDEIHSGLDTLSMNLLNVKQFFREVGNGNFNNDIEVFENQGDIGKSLTDVKDRLKNISEDDRRRNWSNEGFARFGDILRSNSDNLKRLAEDIISELVKYLEANQGAVFVIDKTDEDNPVMKMMGCYAYSRKKYQNKEVLPGQGLVGQSWLEKKSIYMTKIPQEYVNIRSGLGDATPDCIFIVPLRVNEEVYGVVELASFHEFDDFQREFVETLGESIASSISNTRTNQNTKRLLEESQQMTEEMRAQEEEMRQNMEELQATQEEMQRNANEINKKEVNLNALINNTEDSIITINRDYEVLILNDVVKKRYKGTQFEGIDVGFNVLDLLGEVRDEWKGYYDRAFAGERLNFTLRSSVAGEDSFREYFVNPIRDSEEMIIGASIFSRDVTEREKEKLSSERKSEFLDLVEELTKLTAEDNDKNHILTVCLSEICRHMNWSIGHAYFPDKSGSRLESSGLWHIENEGDYTAFQEQTSKKTFAVGEGLPGRVFESRAPSWIPDIGKDDNAPRAKSALKAGLNGAFGFPIIGGDMVFAVLEFYSPHQETPDDELIKLIMHVAIQTGKFIENLGTTRGVRKTGKDNSGLVRDIQNMEKALTEKLKTNLEKLRK